MIKICIDPGHGGLDPGAVFEENKEKDLTLEISKYMKQRAKELGFDVILTRETDLTLDSKKRTEYVRQSKADICISNHINSGGGTGAEVIYSINSDGKLADAILKNLRQAGMPIRRTFTKESTSQKGKDYYYMHRLTYPEVKETVIIEYGFMDNKEDLSKLKNPVLRKQMIEAVLKAIYEYTKIPYQEEKTALAKVENWKDAILKEAESLGLVEKGKHQAEEKADKWFVLAVVLNAIKSLSNKNTIK